MAQPDAEHQVAGSTHASGTPTSADENAALRERLRADRASQNRSTRPPAHLTKDQALAELRRYLGMFPNAVPEVIAVELFGRADQWDEINAVEAALATILKEGDQWPRASRPGWRPTRPRLAQRRRPVRHRRAHPARDPGPHRVPGAQD